MRYAVTCLALVVCCWAVYPVGLRICGSPFATTPKADLQLGNFSISLNVKDIQKSKDFYEKLGFKVSGGDLKRKFVIMQNETATIGLFQGVFEKNSLTFNPGWDRNSKTLEQFQDVREIQQELKKSGLELTVAADESSSGPAFMMLVDPDGNPILVDQHVAKPKR